MEYYFISIILAFVIFCFVVYKRVKVKNIATSETGSIVVTEKKYTSKAPKPSRKWGNKFPPLSRKHFEKIKDKIGKNRNNENRFAKYYSEL